MQRRWAWGSKKWLLAGWLLAAAAGTTGQTLFAQAAPVVEETSDLDQLIKDAAAPSPAARLNAVEALAETPADIRPALPALITALSDKEWFVRRAALVAIGRLGSDGLSALPAVAKTVSDPQPAVRATALELLGTLGSASAVALPAVKKALDDPEPIVQVTAVWAASRIDPEMGPALQTRLPAVVKALSSPTEEVRDEAQETLVELGPNAVPALSAALATADATTAILLVDTLSELGPEAKAAIPALVNTLGRNEPEVVAHAVHALGAMGPAAKSAIPALLPLLTATNPRVRAHTARALGRLDERTEVVTAALSKALTDPDSVVVHAALSAIQELKPTPASVTASLISVLQKADPAARSHAVHTLVGLGPEVVPSLTPALSVEGSRFWAAMTLAELGLAAKPAIPALAKALGEAGWNEKDPQAQIQILMALAANGKDAEVALPQVSALLSSGQVPLQTAAVFVLGKIGPGAVKFAPQLEKFATGSDKILQVVSLWALARIYPDQAERTTKVIPLLVDALKADNPRLRFAAAQALSELHPKPGEVAPVISAAFKDLQGEQLASALDALAAQGEACLPGAIRGLADPSVRPIALGVLQRMGAAAAPAVPELLKLLEDADPATRQEALFALAQIPPAAATALPVVLKLMSTDESTEVRHVAVFCIGSWGAASLAAVPALQANLASEDRFLRLASAWALVKIQPADPAAETKYVPLLVEGLRSERTRVRQEICTALGTLGKRAQAAAPALRKLVTDPDPSVSAAAKQAVEDITR